MNVGTSGEPRLYYVTSHHTKILQVEADNKAPGLDSNMLCGGDVAFYTLVLCHPSMRRSGGASVAQLDAMKATGARGRAR